MVALKVNASAVTIDPPGSERSKDSPATELSSATISANFSRADILEGLHGGDASTALIGGERAPGSSALLSVSPAGMLGRFLDYTSMIADRAAMHHAIQLGEREFKIDALIPRSPVENQEKSSTCWSFAGTSFIQSEVMRKSGTLTAPNLSETYVVHSLYTEKADRHLRGVGQVNFGPGGLAEDVLYAIERYGAVPQSVHSNEMLVTSEETPAVESEMASHVQLTTAASLWQRLRAGTQRIVDPLLKFLPEPVGGAVKTVDTGTRQQVAGWKSTSQEILDATLGRAPETFTYRGQEYTPQTYAQSLGIQRREYLTVMSRADISNYQQAPLDVPDNWLGITPLNVPQDDLVAIAEHALRKGYSLVWDGDVSEITFKSGKFGLAVLPETTPTEETLSEVMLRTGPERVVGPAERLQMIESGETTEDHLMHLVGMATDAHGTKFFIAKNSWGADSGRSGYILLSESYMAAKTVALTLHRDGLPTQLSSEYGSPQMAHGEESKDN